MIRKFSVTYVMEVDEDNNFLSAHEESHREDVHDLVNNVMHDVDDIKINNLVERLSNNVKSRPLLKKGNLKQKLENMIENRIQNYEQAHITIPVDGLSIPDIVRRIINNLKYHDKN